MKKVLLMSLAVACGMTSYAQEEDVTNLIKNAGFDQGLTFTDDAKPVEETTATGKTSARSRFVKTASGSYYAVQTDSKGTNVAGDPSWYGFLGHVEGWEIPEEYATDQPEWKYFGAIPYSIKTGYLAVGDGNPAGSIDAPATKPSEDDTDDNTGFLYLRAGWGGACAYKQTVSLPCAVYRLEYWTINTNPNSTAEATNLSEVVCRKDRYTDDTGLSSTEWTKHAIEFTPVSDFSIQFGYQAANSNSNSNPWLIIDGIKLYKVGEASVEQLYQADLSDLEGQLYDLTGTYADYGGIVAQLEGGLEKIDDVLGGSADEMKVVIDELTALIDSVKSTVAIIPSITALKEKADAAVEKAYPGLADFQTVLSKYDDTISNGEWKDIVAYKDELSAAYLTYMKSQVGTPENPADYTFLVSNPLFVKEGHEPIIADGVFTYPDQDTFTVGQNPSEVSTSEGWTKSGTCTDGDQRLNFAQGRICWNAWSNSNADGKTLAVSQTISNLPNGYYQVSGDLITQADYVNDQHVFGTSSLTSSNSESLTAGTWDSDNNNGAWTTLTTDKVLVHDGTITIGASGTKAKGNQTGWFCATNFKLYYLGAATQEEITAALEKKAQDANTLVAAMHFGADKANATDSIAVYTTSGDIAYLNAAIKLAEASEAKYEEINAEGKTIPTVATALTDGTYGTAEEIARSAYDNTLAYITNGTYNAIDSILTNLKAYIDSYVPAYNNASAVLAELQSTVAKEALTAALADQKTYLTSKLVDDAEVAGLVTNLNARIAAAQAQDNYEKNPNATDYTAMIVNAKSDATDGWNVIKGEGDGPVKSGQYMDDDSSRKYFDSWNSTAGKNNFYMDQVVEGLPNGTYTLAANVRTSGTGAFLFAATGAEAADTTWMEIPLQHYTYTDANTGKDTTVVATDKYGPIWEDAAARIPNMTDKDSEYSTLYSISNANGGIGRGWMKLEIPNIKVVDHALTIGVTCDSTKTGKHSDITWFSATDFTLTLTAVGDNAGWNGPITGINEIENVALKADAIYNINGQRVANMGKQGLYIVVRNGKATKVLKK